MIDEVSRVIAPVVTGERNAATVFDQSDFVSGSGAKSLKLADVKQENGGVLWLDYKTI